MRKNWMILLKALCMACCIMFGFANMEDIYADVQGDYSYEYIEAFYEKGTVEITRYTGNDANLVVPEQIDGYKVAGIGFGAFENCKSLETVELPSGVKTIKWRAFKGCSNLKSVKLPAGLKYLEDDIFMNCSSLASIELPFGVTWIRWGTFEGCSSLKNLKLSAEIDDVTGRAFSGCYNLEKIEVDAGNDEYKSVNGILYSKDGNTLIFCPSGKEDEPKLLDGVNYIDAGAFSGCRNLKSIQLPAGVKIECSGLEFCENLTEINVDPSHTELKSEDGILYSKDGTELVYCPAGKTGQIRFSANVDTIGGGAFLGCNKIINMELPAGVAKIEWGAFSSCGSLKSVNIPSETSDIDGGAFTYCDSLEEIDVETGNSMFASVDGVLYNKEKTELIRYPGGKTDEVKLLESVTQIGFSAFQGCTKLRNLELPEGIITIDHSAFAHCSSLNNILLPSSLKEIKSGAFSNCSSLTSIKIPEGVTEIEGETFLSCENLADMWIPLSMQAMELDIFSYYNRSLRDIYYAGDEKQWKEVRLGAELSLPVYYHKARIHYNNAPDGTPIVPSDTPDTPDHPDTPDTPDTPDHPDIPDNPDTPNVPSAQITITFDAQGGESISPVSVGRNSRLSYIPVTYKSGWIFQGWYTGYNGTGSMLTLGTELSQDTTYYAWWTAAGRMPIGIDAFVYGTAYAGESAYQLLEVRVIYSDGTSDRVYDYTVSQPVLYAGSNYLVVTWNGFAQNIYVQAVSEAPYTDIRSISAFYTGGDLPAGTYNVFDGLVVRAVYSDGIEREITDYALSGNTIRPGQNTVTVHYAGKTAEFFVTGCQYLAVRLHTGVESDIWVTKGADLETVLAHNYPFRSGYQFEGWYLDEGYTQKAGSGNITTDGMHVYAKWRKINSWKLNKSKASLKQGKSLKLSVAGLKNTQIIWKTSNKKVASVSKSGVVKAKKAGTAVITAVTPDGSVMSCTVKVRK